MTATVTADVVDGLCHPAGPADEIARLAAETAWSRRAALTELLDRPDGLDARLIDVARRALELPAPDLLALLDDAWAEVSLYRPTPHVRVVDDPPFAPGRTDTVRWLAGAWAEGRIPAAADALAVSVADHPRGGQEYLYLADAAMVVHLGAPVGMFSTPEGLRLVPAGGGRLTLSGNLRALPAGPHAEGRVVRLPRAGHVPLLNAVPRFAHLAQVDTADPEQARSATAVLTEGQELLAAVWPALGSFVTRRLKGLVVLRYEGQARSHTSVYAPHVLMCTATSPVTVAEALAHETAHGRMFVLGRTADLLENDPVTRYPSPWRSEPRPMISLLNGVHAFVAVCEFYRRLAEYDQRHQTLAERALARQVPRVAAGWELLERHARWAPAGARVRATLAPLVDELVGARR